MDINRAFDIAISAIRDAANLRHIYASRHERIIRGHDPFESDETFRAVASSVAERLEVFLQRDIDPAASQAARSVNDFPVNLCGMVATSAYDATWKVVNEVHLRVYHLAIGNKTAEDYDYLHPGIVEFVHAYPQPDSEVFVAFLEKERDRIHKAELKPKNSDEEVGEALYDLVRNNPSWTWEKVLNAMHNKKIGESVNSKSGAKPHLKKYCKTKGFDVPALARGKRPDPHS